MTVSGMMSAAASLGLSLLWDTDIGLSHVDQHTYSPEEYIKAGAFLATGILNCGVRTEADVALSLLSEHVESKSVPLKSGALSVSVSRMSVHNGKTYATCSCLSLQTRTTQWRLLHLLRWLWDSYL